MPSDHATNFILASLTGSPPPPRPNTLCELPIFNTNNMPATTGSLNPHHWDQFLIMYPDQAFTAQLHGALHHGVKLGYDRPLCSATHLEVTNLPMDNANIHHLHHKIDACLAEGHLCLVTEPATTKLVCLPVGVVPKPCSDKWCTIYHLSHPQNPGS